MLSLKDQTQDKDVHSCHSYPTLYWIFCQGNKARKRNTRHLKEVQKKTLPNSNKIVKNSGKNLTKMGKMEKVK